MYFYSYFLGCKNGNEGEKNEENKNELAIRCVIFVSLFKFNRLFWRRKQGRSTIENSAIGQGKLLRSIKETSPTIV